MRIGLPLSSCVGRLVAQLSARLPVKHQQANRKGRTFRGGRARRRQRAMLKVQLVATVRAPGLTQAWRDFSDIDRSWPLSASNWAPFGLAARCQTRRLATRSGREDQEGGGNRSAQTISSAPASARRTDAHAGRTQAAAHLWGRAHCRPAPVCILSRSLRLARPRPAQIDRWSA